MRQSNIHYGPRGYQQRRNEADRSPFPSRTARTVTQNQQNIPFYGSQNLNNSFISNATKSPLAASQVDNVPKAYNGNFPQYNSISDFNTPLNKPNNMNYFVSQPIIQEKSSDKMKDLIQKIQKLTNRVTKNTERINYLQRDFESKLMLNSAVSEQEAGKIKRQILEQLETSQQISQEKSLSFENLQQLKKEIKDFSISLFKGYIGQQKATILSSLREINSKQDQIFRQTLEQKFDFETKILKETIKGEFDLLSKNISLQISEKIQTALLVIKDELSMIKSSGSTSGNQLNRGKYQYPFRPLLIKYQGSIALMQGEQSLKSSKQGQLELDSEEMLYFIDPQGYLLDNQKYYIVDNLGQRIRLPQKQINILTNFTNKISKNRQKID